MRIPARTAASKARWLLLGAIAAALVGCSGRTRYAPPTGPMPPNTVLLSAMMQDLSARPGFTEALLAQIDKGGKDGPALLTPKLADTMRNMILGKDWQGLNRFPGWTMREINPTVRVVGHVVGKDTEAETLANPGKGSSTALSTRTATDAYIDLGPLSLDRPGTVDLNQPSRLPGFTEQGIVSALGDGVTRGDGPDPAIAPMHPESAQLAYLLNRLALNALDNTPQVTATVSANFPDGVVPPGQNERNAPHIAFTPEQLIEALAAVGHTVTVVDARYFANFGHFHYSARGVSGPAQDVMMPFWVNSEITVPHTRRPLLVPVSHTEYEWFIRGPHVNADVAFYFGIDGKAEFRTMDELNQPWVLGRYAHTYTGSDAVEVTRLSGLMALAYIHQHLARPNLPFGGYYALGVCQDAVAAIEKKLTGHATLFPNTADAALFNDPRDAEINRLIAAIPKDRSGSRPEPERIFGSLPTTDLRAITIPGLAEDLLATQAAWHAGHLHHVRGPHYWIARSLEALGIAIAALVVFRLRRPTPRRPRLSPDPGRREHAPPTEPPPSCPPAQTIAIKFSRHLDRSGAAAQWILLYFARPNPRGPMPKTSAAAPPSPAAQ